MEEMYKTFTIIILTAKQPSQELEQEGKQANSPEQDSIARVQAEKGLWGAQSEKHRSPTGLVGVLQMSCGCWPLLPD